MKRMGAYAEFLAKAGPEDGPLTEDNLLYRIELLQDTWWLEHLCIEEREAALQLAKYRSMLHKLRTPVPQQTKKGRRS